MKPYHSILIFTLSILCTLPAMASLRGNANVMSMPLELILEEAELGDGYYQGALGILYRTGEKVDMISQSIATEWTMKSAEQGHPLGYANKGIIAMQTNFPALAGKHFDQAIDAGLKTLASDGDPLANYCMAEIFSSSAKKDYKSSARYYGRAMNADHETSRGLLGAMHLFGIGIDKNRAKGLRLLKVASENGSPIAAFSLGIAYVRGIGVEVNQEEALKWMKLSAMKGYAQSQFFMARSYQKGDGVAQDFEKSLDYLRKAAAQNFSEAEKALNVVLEMPEYKAVVDKIIKEKKLRMDEKIQEFQAEQVEQPQVEENQSMATKLVSAVKEVIIPEETEKADKEKKAIVTPKKMSTKEAVIATEVKSYAETLKERAESGDLEAMKSLAGRYSIMEQDDEKAAKWYERAAIKGDATSQRFLGVLYMMGKGVPKDYAVARSWFEKASENGDKESRKKLKLLDDLSQ